MCALPIPTPIARQSALGKYGFTVNGMPITLPPACQTAISVDLFPENWEEIFGHLPHPAYFVVVAGVCQGWRVMAMRLLIKKIARNGDIRTNSIYADRFIFGEGTEHGARLFSYSHEIKPKAVPPKTTPPFPKLFAFHMRITSHRIVTFGIGPEKHTTALFFDLVDYKQCMKCNRLFNMPGIVRLRHVFCTSQCLDAALDAWMKAPTAQKATERRDFPLDSDSDDVIFDDDD